MNKADLEAIKARLAAASEGPWNSNSIRMATGEPYPAVYGPSPLQGFLGEIRIADCDTHCLSEDICLANAKLIAHAPTDIAALIAEVERLQGKNNALSETLENKRKIEQEKNEQEWQRFQEISARRPR